MPQSFGPPTHRGRPSDYVAAMVAGDNPPQLLMQIQGEGGTGKSKVIQTATDFFAEKDCLILLIKSAYTGITASIINGKTAHTIRRISLNEGLGLLDEAKQSLHHFWKDIKYRILDEHSMLAR